MSPTHPFHPHARRRRAALASLLIGTLVCSLGSAFFRTQIIQNADYTLRSDDNRLRVITSPAPRGAVYDRNGELIAETVTTYMLFLDTPALDSTKAGLAALAKPLQLSDSAVAALIARHRTDSE